MVRGNEKQEKKAIKKKNRRLTISKEERSSIKSEDKPKEVKAKTERVDDIPLLISSYPI